MFKFLWWLIKLGTVLFCIGLILAIFELLFKFLAEYWWLLALCVILAATIFFFVSTWRKKKMKQRVREIHAEVELYRLDSLADIQGNQQTAYADEYQDENRIKPSFFEEQERSVHNSTWLNFGGVEAELLNIDLMDGHEFEYWCAALLRENGFQQVEVTQASGDDGVDILAEKDSIRYAIQCKRYNTYLGNKPIQEVHTGKAVYNCHVGAVMTNQYFTDGGKRAAMATGTLLWDRDWLRKHIVYTKSPESSSNTEALSQMDDLDGDEMLLAAVDVVLETRQASVPMLQKRLNLGYARAARIMDEMEEKGFVGPFQGSKPRSILLTKEQWNQRKWQ